MRAVAGHIGALNGARRYGLAAAMGGLLGLAHTPFGIWPLAFVAGPVLCALWQGGGGFRVGWAAGTAFFALTLHWIVEPFLVDAARHGWMAPFALALMASGLGLFWGGAFWLAAWLRRGGFAALALTFAAAEAARGSVLTGFPWLLPGYVWVDTPVIQALALVGPYGLSLLTLLAIFALGARPVRWTSPVVLFAVLAAWLWGDFRQAADSPPDDGPVIRIVQPNIPQQEKWDPRHRDRNFARTLDLTAAESQLRPARHPDVVIWPEVAVSFAIEAAPPARDRIAAAAGGATVLLGSLAQSPVSGRWRNALFALDAIGTPVARYDKSHLVPFGEYMPFAKVMERLGLLALAGQGPGMEPGAPPAPISLPGLPPFVPLICYEGAFPGEVRAAVDGAAWIVLVTNDAWFGNWAGPAQHFALARMRAIETGLPLARAANTGISALISPYGRVIDPISINTRGRLDAILPKSATKTPYIQLGEMMSILISIMTLIIAIGHHFYSNDRKY